MFNGPFTGLFYLLIVIIFLFGLICIGYTVNILFNRYFNRRQRLDTDSELIIEYPDV
jgi:hypothetical protein